MAGQEFKLRNPDSTAQLSFTFTVFLCLVKKSWELELNTNLRRSCKYSSWWKSQFVFRVHSNKNRVRCIWYILCCSDCVWNSVCKFGWCFLTATNKLEMAMIMREVGSDLKRGITLNVLVRWRPERGQRDRCFGESWLSRRLTVPWCNHCGPLFPDLQVQVFHCLN